MAGNAAAPAARLRIRRRGCCVTNRRSVLRIAVRRRGVAALRTNAFMEPSHTGCAAGGYHRAACPASGLWPIKAGPKASLRSRFAAPAYQRAALLRGPLSLDVESAPGTDFQLLHCTKSR